MEYCKHYSLVFIVSLQKTLLFRVMFGSQIMLLDNLLFCSKESEKENCSCLYSFTVRILEAPVAPKYKRFLASVIGGFIKSFQSRFLC